MIALHKYAAPLALLALAPLSDAHAETARHRLRDLGVDVLLACRDPDFSVRDAMRYTGECSDDKVAKICGLLEEPTLKESELDACGVEAIAAWRACRSVSPPPQCASDDPKERVLAGFQVAQGFVPLSGAGVSPLPILTGIADFFVARAEAELATFMRDRMGEFLCPEGNAPSKELLPHTCAVLTPGDTTSISDPLAALRDAFRQDFAELPANLLALLSKHVTPLDTTEQAFLCLGTVGFETGRALITTGIWGGFDKLMNASPKACDGVALWADTSKLRVTLARIAALIQKDIVAKTPIDAVRILFYLNQIVIEFDGDAEIKLAVEFVERIVPSVLLVADLSRQLSHAHGADPTTARKLVEASFALVSAVAEFVAEKHPDKLSQDDLRSIVAFQRALSAVFEKRYLDAFLRLAAVPKIRLALKAKMPGTLKRVWNALEKYGTVLAQIAEAERAEDVEKIMESVASPAGSWREYRRRPWAGNIAGLLGASGGWEVPFGADAGAFAAVTLPIGIETGVPIDGDWTFNILLSLIDLGGLTNVPLGTSTATDSGADGAPKFESDLAFTDVLAPGVFLQLGLGDSPFVFSLGAELAPAARHYFNCESAASTCESTEVLPAVRFFALLGVDMPILPLW